MNINIMNYSSIFFYKNMLYPNASNKNIKLLSVNKKELEPVFLIDTAKYQIGESFMQEEQSSRCNLGEVRILYTFYFFLEKKFNLGEFDVGIISPYKEQCYKIREYFKEKKKSGCIKYLPEISSVDSFQGREKEAILFSAVRSNRKKQIGFLKDDRRMNVAITRAKRLFVLVGNSETMNESDFLQYFLKNFPQSKNERARRLTLEEMEQFPEVNFKISEVKNSGVF